MGGIRTKTTGSPAIFPPRLRLASFFFAPLHMTAGSQRKLSLVSSSNASISELYPCTYPY